MTDEMDVDLTVVDDPDHVGPDRIERGYIERDSTPYYGGISKCMSRYLEHGYSYVERPSGGEILYGFRSREGDARRTPLAMIVRLEGGKGEPLEGRAWLDSQRIVEVSSLESDAEPEPDRLASIPPRLVSRPCAARSCKGDVEPARATSCILSRGRSGGLCRWFDVGSWRGRSGGRSPRGRCAPAGARPTTCHQYARFAHR